MVKIRPPPRPMLCGFRTDVQIKAAIAASTAEPPRFKMSLWEDRGQSVKHQKPGGS